MPGRAEFGRAVMLPFMVKCAAVAEVPGAGRKRVEVAAGQRVEDIVRSDGFFGFVAEHKTQLSGVVGCRQLMHDGLVGVNAQKRLFELL